MKTLKHEVILREATQQDLVKPKYVAPNTQAPDAKVAYKPNYGQVYYLWQSTSGDFMNNAQVISAHTDREELNTFYKNGQVYVPLTHFEIEELYNNPKPNNTDGTNS